MKHTITGTLYYYKPAYLPEPMFIFNETEFSKESDFIPVSKHSFEVDVPDDFNPVPLQVAALQEQARLIRLEMGDKLRKVEESIGKLQCLTNEVEAA